MFKDYTAYRVASLQQKTDETSITMRMLTTGKMTVVEYWKAHGEQWPNLQKLALQVFSFVASSAASERNFSTFGFVHTKLRNCLSQESVDKLVYIPFVQLLLLLSAKSFVFL